MTGAPIAAMPTAVIATILATEFGAVPTFVTRAETTSLAGKTTGARKSQVVVARMGPTVEGPLVTTPMRSKRAMRADSNQAK